MKNKNIIFKTWKITLYFYRKKVQLIDKVNSLNKYTRIYSLIGIISFLSFIYIILVQKTALFSFVEGKPIAHFFLVLLSLLLTYNLLREQLPKIIELFETTIYRWLFLALSSLFWFLIKEMNNIQTAIFINDFTRLDASFFPFGWSLITYISSIPIVIMGVVILLLFFVFVPQFFIKRKDEDFIKFTIIFGRGVSIASLIYVFILLLHNVFNSKNVEDWNKNIFLASEFYSSTYCKNKKKFEFFADIGKKGLIAVYNEDNKTFKIRKCEIKVSDE